MKGAVLASVALLGASINVMAGSACGSSCGSYNKEAKSYDKADKPDIVDTAVSAGSFSTLVAAVQAAELVELLKSEGPFTVFAPTDEAFAKLPAGTVDGLLLPENRDQLVAVLKYHVVPGKVAAADVVKLNEATTAQGSAVTIKASDEGVMINDASVVKTDIETSNGIIHVIDSVILPPS